VGAAGGGSGYDAETSRRCALELDLVEVLERGLGRYGERVEDEAVLEALHTPHVVALLLDGVVAVDDAEAAVEGHVDGHLRLGDSIHWARDEGHVERDGFRCLAAQGHVGRIEGDVARKNDVVLVCVPIAFGEELLGAETVLLLEPLALDYAVRGVALDALGGRRHRHD
jgi:hypothetical protein